MNGKFITFEGGEGVGKSTQCGLLAERLREQGNDVLLTREPGGSAGAEDIRELLVIGEVAKWDSVTETLLHFAARRDHLRETVFPALEAEKWVVCDRFVDSTMAYQGYAGGVSHDAINALAALVSEGLTPDLTLILDMPVEDGLGRATARNDGEDRYERMGIDFHRRLREAFLDIAANAPDRCAVIDAGEDLESVQKSVWSAVQAHFGLTK